MLQLDGSQGEGGGQMVRTALSLSTLTGKPFRMINIRAGRPQPGLKAQHLQAIKALKTICGAQATEVKAGDQDLTFEPGTVFPGQYYFDIGTAGSISLLLQALLPPLLFGHGRSKLWLKGGTCGKWQPPVEYTREVLLPYIGDLAGIEADIKRRGYYPKGGGEVEVSVEPQLSSWKEAAQLPPLQLEERGPLEEIRGIAFAAEALAEREVGERMARAAEEELGKWKCPINISTAYGPARNPGAGITLWARFNAPASALPRQLGAEGLGERGKPAEKVGREAAKRLNRALRSGDPVDEHLADQLVPYLGLIPGSRMRVSQPSGHLLSNIGITERFLPVRFERKGNLFEVVGRQEG